MASAASPLTPRGHIAGAVSRLSRRGAERLVATTNRPPSVHPCLPKTASGAIRPSSAAPTHRAAIGLRGGAAIASAGPAWPLAVAVSATGALLLAALVSSAFRTGGGGAPMPSVQPSASSFTFAPTTVPDLAGLPRPAEGVVHLVATTADGTPDRQRRRARRSRHHRHHRRRRAGATAIVAYLADGTAARRRR